ncbi:MAG TPA: PEGA domain-containing protein, partial [Polyangiaceae bacterium]
MCAVLRWVRWLAFLVACAALAAPARADDVADEADLQFQLGAESYQRGDFRGALQHFLASNRLVANKNVLFNIARCYEKLTQYPEAYRYYTQALEGETDAAAIAKINAALGQLRANVAIIKVTSDPPGATLYVNRRDLGPRGNAPRTLGLSAGTYKIIGEFPGYEPASVDVPNVRVGSETPVALNLKPILGTVKVTGVPLKARVRVDDRLSKPVCTVPCELPLAPGRHVLFAEQDGYQTGEISVEVAAHRTQTVSVRLEPRVGSLVVSTDEPGALVEIDERPRGFTPAILPTPVGEHRVKVSLRGFRSIEQKVTIQQETEARLDLVLTQSEEVVAASRTAESVEDAPSSVSIVPRQEIRRLEYPTIAEAGRSVRGFYFSDDRSYVTLGSRGIGRLGSYGNRFLVLQDGQPTNDNWLGSSYLGYDALSDLGDVERIEFVRGPGSVLYGTSAFSGVINLITRDREVPPGVEMGVGTALDGVAHARARGDIKFGKDAGMWTSISGARSRGRDFFFPQFVADTPPEIAGNARGVDGFNAGTLHGRAYFRDWNLQWFAHLHEKHMPTGEFDTTLGDGRTRQRDTRLFLEAKGEPEIARGLKLLSRLHLNHYRFDGYYARQPVDGGVEIDTFRGSWMGLEERLTWSPTPSVRVMAGGEGQLHFQVDQKVRDDSFGVSGYFLDGCGPTPGSKGCTYRVGAGYLVGDAALS